MLSHRVGESPFFALPNLLITLFYLALSPYQFYSPYFILPMSSIPLYLFITVFYLMLASSCNLLSHFIFLSFSSLYLTLFFYHFVSLYLYCMTPHTISFLRHDSITFSLSYLIILYLSFLLLYISLYWYHFRYFKLSAYFTWIFTFSCL